MQNSGLALCSTRSLRWSENLRSLWQGQPADLQRSITSSLPTCCGRYSVSERADLLGSPTHPADRHGSFCRTNPSPAGQFCRTERADLLGSALLTFATPMARTMRDCAPTADLQRSRLFYERPRRLVATRTHGAEHLRSPAKQNRPETVGYDSSMTAYAPVGGDLICSSVPNPRRSIESWRDDLLGSRRRVATPMAHPVSSRADLVI